MFRSSLLGCAFFVALLGVPTSAQEAVTPAEFQLELNTVGDNAEGTCILTYVGTNQTGVNLSEVAYEVAVFDASGIVTRLLVLDLGAFAQGRTKVFQFGLAGSACSDISRIVLNDVRSCTLTEDGSGSDICLSALTTSSRATIQFGM